MFSKSCKANRLNFKNGRKLLKSSVNLPSWMKSLL